MTATVLRIPPAVNFTSEQFYDLCRINPNWKLEREATGDLVIMSPTGGETGARNADILIQLGLWNQRKSQGIVFDSSTGFHLPNGADRSPDVAWVKKERWQGLSLLEREKFPPLAPDFVIELMSPTDNLSDAQTKMIEYQQNGVKMGWLINRRLQQVEIYQLGKEREVLTKPKSLSGDPILVDFRLNLTNFW
ncbi:MAG: Uma2 family endonuclease [Synechocystis sp.]|nr:Uma2 family endonuclease [Synechocystis sp.]